MVPLAGLIGIRKDPGILTIGGTPGTWHQLHSQKNKNVGMPLLAQDDLFNALKTFACKTKS